MTDSMLTESGRLTTRELAEELDVSVEWIRRAMRDGRLPKPDNAHKGKGWFWSRERIDEWRRQEATEESIRASELSVSELRRKLASGEVGSAELRARLDDLITGDVGATLDRHVDEIGILFWQAFDADDPSKLDTVADEKLRRRLRELFEHYKTLQARIEATIGEHERKRGDDADYAAGWVEGCVRQLLKRGATGEDIDALMGESLWTDLRAALKRQPEAVVESVRASLAYAAGVDDSEVADGVLSKLGDVPQDVRDAVADILRRYEKLHARIRALVKDSDDVG